MCVLCVCCVLYEYVFLSLSVQEGMLKGIDLMTRGLVEIEMLDVLAADVHDVDQDEASEHVLVSGDRVVYGRV